MTSTTPPGDTRLPEVFCCCGRVYSAHGPAGATVSLIDCPGFVPRPATPEPRKPFTSQNVLDEWHRWECGKPKPGDALPDGHGDIDKCGHAYSLLCGLAVAEANRRKPR